jgi:hypothetical protein
MQKVMADRYKAGKVGVKLLSTGKDVISPFVKPANSKYITDKVASLFLMVRTRI